MLRGLIRDLGGPEPARHAPRQVATAVAFPTGDRAGARPTVQHRRRARQSHPSLFTKAERARPAAVTARAAAEALFARLDKATAN